MKIKFVLLIFTLSAIYSRICTAQTIKIGAIIEQENEHRRKAFLQAVENIKLDSYDIQAEIAIPETNDAFGISEATCSLIKNGVVGILGPTDEDNSNIVQSICDEKDIPHLDVNWNEPPIEGTVVNVYPNRHMLTQMYIAILKRLNYDSFVILYENDDSLKRIASLIRLYDTDGYRVVARQLDKNNTGNYRPVLKEVWKSGATHFILDCSIEILPEVLCQAQQVGLMTNIQSYIITNLDLHTIDLTPYQFAETNVTGMQIIDPENEQILEIAINISENPEVASVLQLDMALIYDVVSMLGEALKELPSNFEPPSINCEEIGAWTHGSTIVNFMKRMNYPGLTGYIKFDNMGYRSDFNVQLTELRENGLSKIGNWSSSGHLNISYGYTNTPIEDDNSLVNKTFVVITCLTEPFGMLKESSNQLYGNDRFEGFAIDLIHELSLMEGFNYTFILRDDKDNGAYSPKLKRWTGMIGDVMYGVADLAISDMTITSKRQEVVDFSSQFMNLGISILFQKPKKAPPSFFSFADPFALDVWKSLAFAFFGVSISLFILGRICPSEWTNPYACIEEPEFLVNQLSLRNCFWFSTGAIMQQGSEIAPFAISTRMVSGMWWFFTLIMVSSYTANLAAFLTTENPDALFSNVQELLENCEKKNIKFGAKKGGATFHFFKGSVDKPEYQQIYEYMKKYEDEVMVTDNAIGVAKAEKETYAFFMESTSIDYETQRKCNLTQVGGPLDSKGYGIAMRKNSTYRNKLSTAILKLQESGKLADIKRKWWEERRGGGLCVGEDENTEAKPLNLKNVEGVFWVTIAGTLSACILVYVEMILHVVKKSIKTKTPIKTALMAELKFYFKFSGMVKPVIYNNSEDGSNKSSEKEIPYDHVDIPNN